MTTPRQERCEKEITRLHEFFVDWFTAGTPNTDEEFEKGTANLAPNFHLISPRGTVVGQQDLLKSLRKSYGIHQVKPQGKKKKESISSFAKKIFQIEIKNCRLVHEDQDSCVMQYEEWQYSKYSTTARISTAILKETHQKLEQSEGEEEGDDEYNGLEWVHVHETWMPEDLLDASENADKSQDFL